MKKRFTYIGGILGALIWIFALILISFKGINFLEVFGGLLYYSLMGFLFISIYELLVYKKIDTYQKGALYGYLFFLVITIVGSLNFENGIGFTCKSIFHFNCTFKNFIVYNLIRGEVPYYFMQNLFILSGLLVGMVYGNRAVFNLDDFTRKNRK